jgi:hypothetical protein
MIGIRCVWDDAGHTVIRAYIGETWTWDDVSQSMQTINRMMGSAQHQVDVIAIMRPTTPFPAEGTDHIVAEIYRTMPLNWGVFVFVGGNPELLNMIRAISRANPLLMGRIFMTDLLGDAYRIISMMRPEVQGFDSLIAV